MAGADPTRTSWPELVGIPATEVMRINHDRPELAVEALKLDIKLIKGFNLKCVRVFFHPHDTQGLIAKVPVAG